MSPQVLYRKWRSQTFDEVIAQEHVTRTLRNALRDGRIGHAYLFAGPRGTGKTSMARLLAKAVNCLGDTDEKPCNRCPICVSINEGRALDLIEIDAASNRGIDEVRDLRDKVGFRPTECRYRVYILDEAHMLTTPAFNALLKTLEEPPEHAIFVLVTTEPQNIPMTILSRCQRFDFRRIPLADIVSHLKAVATEEGLQVTDAALEAIARQATGSMRDALSLLDQLMAYRQEEITLARVQEVLGTAPQEAVSGLVRSLVEEDPAAGLRLLNEALDQGVEPRQFGKDVVEYLRGILILKAGGDPSLLNVTAETLAQMQSFARRVPLSRLLSMIQVFNQAGQDLKDGIHPRLPLEMALVEAASPEATVPTTPVAVVEKEQGGPEPAVQAPAREPVEAARIGAGQQPAETVPSAVAEPAAIPQPEAARKIVPPLAWFQENWSRVISLVRERNLSVAALLTKSCEPVEVVENVLTVGFYHAFHQERVSQPKNKEILEEVLSEMAGLRMGVKGVRIRDDKAQQQIQPSEAEREREEGEDTAAASDPIVQEAVRKYGARVTRIRPGED